MALIAGGGGVLSMTPGALGQWNAGALLVVAACLFWAIDNNLTRRISAGDPISIAAIKGCVAAVTNLALAALAGASCPDALSAIGALAIGLGGYGVSLALFVVALRDLGAARTGAYFSTAPFVGVAIAIGALGEPAGPSFWLAAGLMAAGVWLHVSERHEHAHTHEQLDHEHAHAHDDHHRHMHDFAWDGTEPHVHPHRHLPMTHRHPHYPDIHHRHRH